MMITTKTEKKKTCDKRRYVRVSEEQRVILVQTMVHNKHMTLLDACKIANLNFECARAIWNKHKR